MKLKPFIFTLYLLTSISFVNCSIERKAYNLYKKAIKEVNRENFSKASEYFETAYKMDTTLTSALFNQGLCLTDLSKYTESNEILFKVLKTDYPKSDIYFSISYNYFLINQYDKALQYADSTLLYDTTNLNNYFLKIEIFGEIGEFEKAAELCYLILSKNQNHYEAHCYLGLILEQLEQYDLALEHLDIAQKINPKDYKTYLLKWIIYSDKTDKDNACLNFNLAVKYGYKYDPEEQEGLYRCN